MSCAVLAPDTSDWSKHPCQMALLPCWTYEFPTQPLGPVLSPVVLIQLTLPLCTFPICAGRVTETPMRQGILRIKPQD